MKKISKNKKILPISDYDYSDTTQFIDRSKRMKITDLGFALPNQKVTQVVSLRLPTQLLNALRSLGTQKDVPYQSLIKLFLWDRVHKELKHS